MLLSRLAETSRAVGATRSRSEKTERLAELLRELEGDEVIIGVSFLCGELRQGRIGIGYAAVQKVVGQPAAEKPSLDLRDLDRAFDSIAGASGEGSTAKRIGMLVDILRRGTLAEQEFIVRLLIGELRQGALEGVMLDAVATACYVPKGTVRRAAMLSGSIIDAAVAAFDGGAAALDQFTLQVFRPIQPMLAQPGDDIAGTLERLERGAFELKLDGARIQVHRSGDEVRVFTRQLHDVTAAVPEVVESALALPVRELVLDGEVLALKPDGRPEPFQTTMRRLGRKLGVDEMREAIALTPFFFDCLSAGGDVLIDRSAEERFAILGEIVPEASVVPRVVTDRADRALEFFRGAIDRGHEGVMAKSLDAPYEAGGRGGSWLKLKPCYTLDLVILAAEWGSGRRKGFLSNLHLGARDPSSGGFAMVGKTFKGLTDAMLEWQTSRLGGLAHELEDHVVHVTPELLVEVAFNEVQTSQRYDSGVALRFARVKRYRPDKTPAEADTIDTIRAIRDGRGEPMLR